MKNNNNILCVICKVQLNKKEERSYKCPKCHNTYTLGYEIVEYEDDFETSHEEEQNQIELAGIGANGPGLEVLEDDNSGFESIEKKRTNTQSKRLYSKTSIYERQ